jgi:hypothetical protein
MLLYSLYNKNKENNFDNGTFIAKRLSQEIELAAKEK